MHPTSEPGHAPPNAAPPPLDPRYDELSDQLRTTQAEISQIRLERKEEKKPWWRQTAIVISIFGLLLSSGFSVYTVLDQARQRLDQARQRKATSLDSRLADIVALRMEDARQAAALASTNLTAYRMWTSAALVKRAMLVDAVVAAVHDLHDDISATAALAVGTELIQDGRYPEAEKIVNVGLKAARAAQSSTGALTSLLAEVYMLQGNPLYNPARGRDLYNQAIDSFSNRVDFSALNNKLSVILFWAPAEAGLGNPKESAQLIQLARQTLAASPLPAAVKAVLAGMTDNVANQIQQANASSLYEPSRLLGNWWISDSENKKSSLVIAILPGSPVPAFERDQIEAGILANRINGTIFVTDPNHMRLDWNVALTLNRGAPMQIAGYSDVRLHPNGVLNGIDYPFGLPSKTWTARKIQPTK
jgi:hypothetical protein